MTFDPNILGNFTLFGIAFGAAFIAALWLSLVIWTYRDIRSRARDPLARVLAVLVVAVLFLPGLLVYAILRPARTLEEEYQRTLEEEALLQTIEEVPVCPGCSRHIEPDWMACPNCHTRLKKRCHQCGRLMELPWNLCPYCTTPAPGMRRENITMEDALQALPVEPPADEAAPAPVESMETETPEPADENQAEPGKNAEESAGSQG
ncbi:MAG: zinc ribbon domain-containing protein [Chloroflexi bacterium]|nr:zinc ribbon domain-containing protein [Chloroflexota bacterium]